MPSVSELAVRLGDATVSQAGIASAPEVPGAMVFAQWTNASTAAKFQFSISATAYCSTFMKHKQKKVTSWFVLSALQNELTGRMLHTSDSDSSSLNKEPVIAVELLPTFMLAFFLLWLRRCVPEHFSANCILILINADRGAFLKMGRECGLCQADVSANLKQLRHHRTRVALAVEEAVCTAEKRNTRDFVLAPENGMRHSCYDSPFARHSTSCT